MSKLRIESGHGYAGPVIKLDSDVVRFFAEDGRCMFEVLANDEKSIEVRGFETTLVNGVVRTNALLVKPAVSNAIYITTEIYEAAK